MRQPGHGIALRYPVHGQGSVVKVRLHLGRGTEDEVAVDEVFVDIVGQHPNVGMPQEDIGQALHLGPRIGGPRGVRGRIQQHPFRLGRNGALEIFGLQLEVLLERRRHDDGRAARDQDHVGIADPERRRDHDLVAGVAGGEKGVEQDLLAAGADDRLRGLIVEIVLALELGNDRFLKRHDAGHRRIFRLAALDRRDRRGLDVVRRVEVRLTDRKADDLAPLGLQLAGFLRHRDGGRWFDAGQRVGDEGHGTLRLI